MATGKELKNAIKGKGLLVQDAADKLGISRQTLSAQFGKAEIDPDLLQNVKTKLKILLNEGHEANYTVTELLALLRMEKESLVKEQDALKREQGQLDKAQDTIHSQQETIKMFTTNTLKDLSQNEKIGTNTAIKKKPKDLIERL